jgi:hypothetical protein
MGTDITVFYFLIAVVLAIYAVLGSVQATAIAKGLARQGYGKASSLLVALLLAFVPLVGGAAAVLGARGAWGWSTSKGVFWFFGSLLAILALIFLG